MLKNVSESLQHNRWSGFGSVQRKSREPLMLTMKMSGDSTHHCWSPTLTVNGRDLTLPTRTQTSPLRRNAMTWRPVTAVNTVLTQHSLKLFTRNPVVCFLEVDKACEDVFSILPIFLKILLESEVWTVLLRPDENRTGYHSGLIQLFRGLFVSTRLAT